MGLQSTAHRCEEVGVCFHRQVSGDWHITQGQEKIRWLCYGILSLPSDFKSHICLSQDCFSSLNVTALQKAGEVNTQAYLWYTVPFDSITYYSTDSPIIEKGRTTSMLGFFLQVQYIKVVFLASMNNRFNRMR